MRRYMAEDEEKIRETIKAFLDSEGYEVSAFPNGDLLFEKFLVAPCDLVILAVTSNVVLSLGMVGALSIVRFRTAIKDPLDLVFLFWALAGGIVLGAGMLPLAIMGYLLIGGVLLGFVSRTEHDSPLYIRVNQNHCIPVKVMLFP